ITPQAGHTPFYSTVTGTLTTDTTTLDTHYWYRNLRQTVLFADTAHTLITDGHHHLIEISTHPVLTTSIQDILDTTDTPAHATGTLRRHKGDWTQFLTSAAQLHTHGALVDWTTHTTPATGRPVDLPTYAFQHQRYWLTHTPTTSGDASAFGLDTTHHPFLTANLELPDGSRVFTGTLSTTTHPWLNDHAITTTPLLPGTAFVDLALHTGHHTGHPHLEELTLHAPLLLNNTPLDLQATLTPPQDEHRTLTIRSRPDSDTPWTTHATATLTTTSPADDQAADLTTWPPANATALDVSDAYPLLADHGYTYGPAFQGLTAAWRDNQHTYADITLPDTGDSDGSAFDIHPALLDAALHAIALQNLETPGDTVAVPFSWSGVRLHAVGASSLRVRFTTTGENTFAITAADANGTPVASIDALTLRPLPAEQLADSAKPLRDSLFHIEWTPLTPSTSGTDANWAWLDTAHFPLADGETITSGDQIPRYDSITALTEALDTDTPATVLLPCAFQPLATVEELHQATRHLLTLIQQWLLDDRLTTTRLAICTRNAIATHPDEDVHDLTASPLWGLIRTAQSENPERFTLIDLDTPQTNPDTLHTALATNEPQLAIRNNTIHAPRLTRTTTSNSPASTTPAAFDPDGTVLITGGTGTLGSLLAHHLVTQGQNRLLLTSRSGPNAEGADQLRKELTDLGAHITITACDTADPDQLTTLLADIPAEHPLTAVIHTAGALADATVENLTPEQLDTVLLPKADAAWNLHHQTRHLDLAAFILYSSAAGTLGNPGQANYAAANTFLDALAHHRQALGLPATSLAWGLWEQSSSLTGHLNTNDHARINRTGIAPLTTTDALALFDHTLTTPQPHYLTARLNTTALRNNPDLPPIYRTLVTATRPATANNGNGNGNAGQSLTHTLTPLTETEQEQFLLGLVRDHVATALGHTNPNGIDEHRGFFDMGLDSLTAVELRNKLGVATGLRLPTTAILDHPTPTTLAHYLRTQLVTDESVNPSDVFAALDKIDVDSLAPTLHAEARTRIVSQLQRFLIKLGEDPESILATQEISSSSDEEIFSMIDNELGLS
ncbi:SDR family NAD(P)-dependent oxidoreductase, partial [Kitasatospora sp. NPDC008115]|uniref:SDR family NAD(P)-dependent oxidoreductase n=1 Tax=Kitasatospora sp. NPDC008115 TaxID=3364022 RepID=UPI0036EEDFF5